VYGVRTRLLLGRLAAPAWAARLGRPSLSAAGFRFDFTAFPPRDHAPVWWWGVRVGGGSVYVGCPCDGDCGEARALDDGSVMVVVGGAG
jgi:hypothetical protein